MIKDLESILIDDKEYAILKEETYKDYNYLYLSSLENENDTLIRKIPKNNRELILPLDDDKEFNLACLVVLKIQKEFN